MGTSVLNVAEYILEKQGEMPATQLQKLCYFAQVRSLAWDGEPLFEDVIQAWADGPVMPALYEKHKWQYLVCAEDVCGDVSALSLQQRELIDEVCSMYAPYSAEELAQMSREEKPWLDARKGELRAARSSAAITPEAIASSLVVAPHLVS